MLFSIITPVYNTEKYLDDYFKSILMQECKDYEVICIDDGSNDKSGDILNAYAKKIIISRESINISFFFFCLLTRKVYLCNN